MLATFINTLQSKRTLLNVLTISWLILVFILSVVPFSGFSKNEGPNIIIGIRDDYWQHLLIFFVTGVVLAFTYHHRISFYNLLILGLIYASICELIQYAVPYRTFNPVDLGLNVGGIAIGLLIGRIINYRFKWV